MDNEYENIIYRIRQYVLIALSHYKYPIHTNKRYTYIVL